MNRYLVLSLVIIVCLAGWFLSSSQSAWQGADMASTGATTATTSAATDARSAAKVTTAPVKKTTTTTAPKSAAAAYKSVITKTDSYRCDYEQVSPTQRTSGRVYVADGKMRTELHTSGVNVTANSLAVYDGTYLYTWTEGLATGIKTQPTSVAQLPLILPNDLTGSTILGSSENSVSWHCRSWVADATLFAPPTYVKFQ
jgi:hypothetical protein